MFQHILVPLDGSPRAERALPIAARIARQNSSSVLLVQVLTTPTDYSGGLVPVPMLSEDMVEQEVSEATRYLKTVAAQMLAGIETTTEVQMGIPALCLLNIATESHADLIVLCSHGRTGLARWTLGSVAHTLAHESTVPLFVLRENELAVGPSGSDLAQPLCALVPLDGSELAEAALAPAAQLVAALTAPASGALHLAQVIKPAQNAVTKDEETAHTYDVRVHAGTYLAHVTDHMQMTTKELHLATTWSVVSERDVASALVNLAEHGNADQEDGDASHCDLIAISTHGRNSLQRWVMGSVTERVLNATRLPVLIVRPQK